MRTTIARARLTRVAVVGVAAMATASALPAAAEQPPSRPGFSKPRYVDRHLAGGEPLVIRSAKTGRLVYTAHEGTTHLYRDGLAEGGQGDSDFVSNYRNQVNIWYSNDHGRRWKRVNWQGTGFFSNPAQNTGFSDPDLTQDEGGTIYDTGIDLANDSVFSSANGGKDWNSGTANCHDGDRPWLAGGKPGEVFMATDTVEGGHQVFRSTDSAASCGQEGVPDQGTIRGHDYAGDGKLYYDHHNGSLLEPILISHDDSPVPAVGDDSAEQGTGDDTVGLGVGVLPRASGAFEGTAPASFTPHIAVPRTTLKGHWPAMAIDRGDTVYMVWDTDPRKAGTTGGCDGAETPRANSIKMTYSKDHGRTWARPRTVAHPGTTVLWPWVAAGKDGNVSVVWYQYDRVVDPDCAKAGKLRVFDASIFGANTRTPDVNTVNASGRAVHRGDICQGGTTCVATGQDRRLGDLFTNSVDGRGCVLIAASDTTLKDPDTGGPLPTARPLFIQQNSGRSLTGRNCAEPAG
jgi:hypothetical protein